MTGKDALPAIRLIFVVIAIVKRLRLTSPRTFLRVDIVSWPDGIRAAVSPVMISKAFVLTAIAVKIGENGTW